VAERRRESNVDPPWPGGSRFAVCVTHDVDLVAESSTPRQVLRSMRTSLADRPASLRGRALRLARPPVRLARAAYHGVSRAPAADALERCVELERARGVTASYFFTAYPGSDASRYDCVYDFGDRCGFRGERVTVAEIARALADDGFDVGLHGSYNSALAPGLLARERAALEAAAGVEVTTTRQHFLHWEITTTPRLQAAAGLRADSTLGFNRNVGYRAGTSLPFRHHDVASGETLDLVQLPLYLHDGALLRPDALELDVASAAEAVRRLIDRAEELGAVATVVFHPNNLARDDYLELYTTTLDYGLERGAWFASVRDLDTWWRERERRFGTV
jgi:peptidoglycan/xylan/chitin deacetylase (PgdA/CDA1 family)